MCFVASGKTECQEDSHIFTCSSKIVHSTVYDILLISSAACTQSEIPSLRLPGKKPCRNSDGGRECNGHSTEEGTGARMGLEHTDPYTSAQTVPPAALWGEERAGPSLQACLLHVCPRLCLYSPPQSPQTLGRFSHITSFVTVMLS